MISIVYFLLVLTSCHAIKFKVTMNIDHTRGYKPGEIVDIREEIIDDLFSSGIPIEERQYENWDLSDLPYIVRNSDKFDPLDISSECFDDYLYAKLQMKALRHKNVSYTHSMFASGYHSTQNSPRACVPFVNNTNDIMIGYWDNDNEKYLTPLHHDNAINVVWCHEGKKIFLLYPPEDHQNMYMGKYSSARGGVDTVIPYQLENVDLKKYPNVADVIPYVVEVGPSDILYLPYRWAHHVYTTENTTCVTYWFQKNKSAILNEPLVEKEDLFVWTNYEATKKDEGLDQAPEELWWFKYKMGIRLALSNGQVVKIPNAFQNPQRFDLHKNTNWTHDLGDGQSVAHYDRFKCEGTCRQAFHNEISKHKHYFEDLLMTPFHMGSGMTATKYTEDQFLDSHSDFMSDRILSLVYHNTKNWNRKCGGAFQWMGGIGQQNFYPEYNTLYLFIPRRTSDHAIEPVHCGERYGYSGWFVSPKPTSKFLLLTHSFKWANENKPGDVYNIGENMGTRNGVNEDFINDVILKN